MRKKRYVCTARFVLASLLCAGVSIPLFGSPVDAEKAEQVAQAFLNGEKLRWQKKPESNRAGLMGQGFGEAPQTFGIKQVTPVEEGGATLAYVAELVPEGFVIVSPDDEVEPVLGFSFRGRFPFEESGHNALLHLVKWDVSERLKVVEEVKGKRANVEYTESPRRRWQVYLSGATDLLHVGSSLQQWPPDRDGWVRTRWDQDEPWNAKCPYLDPHDPSKGRCAVGCVATAFAQIVSYWKYPGSLHFSQNDGYLSIGDAGVFEIDSDHSSRGFPTFSELNEKLASIKYNGDPIEEAYLSFAAGVKLSMDYGRSSGTWQSDTAFKNGFSYGSAIQRSGHDVWPEWKERVIANMKGGWPVQAGVSKASGDGGHSVIFDGYRTDGFFHVNMGWGGRDNAWYRLPTIDPGIFESAYTIINDLVFDIAPYRGWHQYGSDAQNTFRTPYAAPRESKTKWEVSCSSDYMFSGLVVGTGNKVYATASPRWGGGSKMASVWVINQYGSKVKELVLSDENERVTVPVQNGKGEVFFGTDKGRVYKINPQTDEIRRIYTEPDNEQFFDPPKVDEDGLIYLNTFYQLYCLDGNGNLRWRYPSAKNANGYIVHGSPAIDRERNNVYVDYYDSSTKTPYLLCIDRLSGDLRFRKVFPAVSFASFGTGQASVGSDGTVYVGCYKTLYALNPDNRFTVSRWEKPFPDSRVNKPVAIGLDGTLYISYWKRVGSVDCVRFGALDPRNGESKWEVAPAAADSYDNINDRYVSRDGVVVFTFARENGSAPDTYELYAYQDNGTSATLLWKKDFGTSGGSMAFGPGATIYALPGSYGQTIYAISEGRVGDPDGAGMAYVNNRAPDPPVLVAPSNDAKGLGANVTISWRASDPDGHGLKYDLLLCPLIPNSDLVFFPVASDLVSNSFAMTNLEPGIKYLWRVVVSDGQAPTEGETWAFSTLARVTNSLATTYNLVAVPFEDTTITNAEALTQAVPNCNAVWRWDETVQGWSAHPKGGPNNFPVVPSGAYMVSVTSRGTFQPAGVWAARSISLKRGYNVISLPRARRSVTTAEQLVQSVPNATTVWRWNVETQSWSGHPKGGPNNFVVELGRAYLVYVTADGSW